MQENQEPVNAGQKQADFRCKHGCWSWDFQLECLATDNRDKILLNVLQTGRFFSVLAVRNDTHSQV